MSEIKCCRKSYPVERWTWCKICLDDEFAEKDAKIAELQAVVDKIREIACGACYKQPRDPSYIDPDDLSTLRENALHDIHEAAALAAKKGGA